MSNTESLQLFEDQPIRSAWDEEAEEWYFSTVDVVGVLTEQPDARHASTYWAVLKKRLNEEGASELLTNCKQLKLKASDGKRRATDVANTEQLLRIIQSIPSKKAEPFKLWLAQVGRERIEETLDPELIVDRLVSTYERRGYTREWINQRLQAISARKELTDEWKDRGVQQGKEYAILTDELTRAWSGMTTRQYKNLKGLKKESLRDNMSTTELTLNQLAEVATRELSQEEQPVGFDLTFLLLSRAVFVFWFFLTRQARHYSNIHSPRSKSSSIFHSIPSDLAVIVQPLLLKAPLILQHPFLNQVRFALQHHDKAVFFLFQVFI